LRVIVCGGRNYADKDRVFNVLGRHHITELIEGGATGADALAREWRKCRCEGTTVRADWKRHGRAAGPIRNKRMLDDYSPDLVIAFPGGRGTENMISQAEAAGVPVHRVR